MEKRLEKKEKKRKETEKQRSFKGRAEQSREALNKRRMIIYLGSEKNEKCVSPNKTLVDSLLTGRRTTCNGWPLDFPSFFFFFSLFFPLRLFPMSIIELGLYFHSLFFLFPFVFFFPSSHIYHIYHIYIYILLGSPLLLFMSGISHDFFFFLIN